MLLAQAGLELDNLPSTVSQGLGFQVSAEIQVSVELVTLKAQLLFTSTQWFLGIRQEVPKSTSQTWNLDVFTLSPTQSEKQTNFSTIKATCGIHHICARTYYWVRGLLKYSFKL